MRYYNHDVDEIHFDREKEQELMFSIIKTLLRTDNTYQFSILDDGTTLTLQFAYDDELSNGQFRYITYEQLEKGRIPKELI